MSLLDRRKKHASLLAFCGGLLAATAVGLSAYASHGVADALVQSRLQLAALYALAMARCSPCWVLPKRARLAR